MVVLVVMVAAVALEVFYITQAKQLQLAHLVCLLAVAVLVHMEAKALLVVTEAVVHHLIVVRLSAVAVVNHILAQPQMAVKVQM